MRRLLAVFLMLLVPLQFAWSAAQSLHGHIGEDVSVLGFHTHDHDHDHRDGELAAHDGLVDGDMDNGHNDDGQHGGHYHPVFSSLVIEIDLKLGEIAPDGPPVRPPTSFTSHIPPLFDWPPSARL